MPAAGVEVVDIMMDASFALRSCGYPVRGTSISWIGEDQRPAAGQPCKGVRQVDAIRNDHDIGSITHDLHEQAHTIVGRDMFLTWRHRVAPLNCVNRVPLSRRAGNKK